MPYLRVLMLFEQWQEYTSEQQENEYLWTSQKQSYDRYIEIDNDLKERIENIEKKVQANFDSAPALWQTLI